MQDKTPLEIAQERAARHEAIDYCDQCEYIAVVNDTGYCGISGKLLHPIMFERGEGYGPARRCAKRKEAINMGLTGADLQRLGPEAKKQIMDKLGAKAVQEAKPKTKYHNTPTDRIMPNGEVHTFPSAKEARRYDELALLLKAGRIRNLKLQPQFTITEAFITSEGKNVSAHRYTADFSYEEFQYESKGTKYWKQIVEDVKGGNATKTRDYKNNVKALAERGIFITEV